MLMGAGLFVSLNLLYSQDAASPFQLDSATVAGMSDLEVELKAVESVPPMPADSLPDAGTFWSAQHAPGTAEEWPPLPTSFGMGAWSLGDDGVYLLADLNHVYGHPIKSKKASLTATASVGGIQTISVMSAMDLNPGDGGDDGDTNSDSGNIAPEFSPAVIYGTNLWLAITNLSGGTAGFVVSNTVADVQYEIQSKADLLQTNWNSMGFFYGSEITNWNAASATATNYPNLFYRIRSWQSSDGSGIPDWWELKYFGTTGIDPYADPDGDGWNNLQEFQNGTDPTVFNTPPTPQGVTATYVVSNGMAIVSWLPSPGPVTGYTVTDSDGNTFNFTSATNSFVDNISSDLPDPNNNENIDTTFQIQAHYAGGSSTWSAPVSVEQTTIIASIVPGSQGTACLAVSALPPGTAAIRLTEMDDYPFTPVLVTNYDIPIGNFTNGLCQLPNNPVPGDGNNRWFSGYNWYAQAVGANGQGLTATSWLIQDYTSPQDNFQKSWLVPPFFDGRAQLKQNLIFQLRAAVADRPFQYMVTHINGGSSSLYSSPANYAYAGYYSFLEYDTDNGVAYEPTMDTFLPFEENYFDRNFVFDTSYLNSNGRTTTGVGGSYGYNGSGGLTILVTGEYFYNNYLELPITYKFTAPSTNGAPISSVLSTNQTRWLATYPVDSAFAYLWEIGITNESAYGAVTNVMSSNAKNWFGLSYLSAEIGSAGPSTTTLYAGGSANLGEYFYPETAQPQFQLVEYDYWSAPNPFFDVFTNGTDFPGMAGLSATHTNSLLVVPVGSSIQLACYAKLEVANSYYGGVYGFLQQYFDKAYQTDTNGVATTTTTGVLSPYGDFFATQAGPAALVTMPDPDTGARGTSTVYCVSMNVDANHDGNMDLSFNGPDATSQSSPMEFWVNDGNIKPGINGNLDTDMPVPQNPPNYSAGQITCQRDLENFARLWVCGVPALPASQGYSVTLTCNAISGNPAINLYTDEGDGGIGYLTDTNLAQSLVAETELGAISPANTYTFPANFFDGTNKYFLFEGAGIGEGQFTLTIYQNGNVIAQTSAFIDLHDVKDFFEQDVIQDNMSGAKSNWTSYVEAVLPAIASGLGNDTNMIVLVHGINVRPWDCIDDAGTVCKRLYWAGFQGKFAEVEWPCNLLTPKPSPFSPAVFNDSELQGYKASTALTTCLNGLKTRFPNYRLNILAHSQGNTVVSEAIKQGFTSFDTYILTQGALPDSAYDVNAPTNATLLTLDGVYPTPEWQPMGYHGVYTNLPGRIVNFYNPNDPVLDWWVTDQELLKPSVYIIGSIYNYDGTNSYFNPEFGSGYLVTDPEESRADVSRSRTLPIGQSGPSSAHGVIQSAVDLYANFGFYNAFPADHSAQWTWPIQTTRPYFQQVLRSCQIIPAP